MNGGERFGDCRYSGAGELIAFHLSIGKQFFMIASSVNFSLFIFAYFCVQLAPNVALQYLAQDKYFSEDLITLLRRLVDKRFDIVC